MTRSKLIILCGLPGAGKSTWARRFFDETLIISPDQIRAQLYDGDYDPSYNVEVFHLFHSIIDDFLAKAPHIAVADSTALTAESREILRDIALKCNAEIHLVLFTNTHQAREQNPQREPRWVVPDAAMDYMMQKYERSVHDIQDEQAEGCYDSVTYISSVQ